MTIWRSTDAALEVREYGAVHATEDLVSGVSDDAWNAMRLTVSKVPGGQWAVAAEQHVGVASLRVGTRTIPLRVTPKIPVDALWLADYAFQGQVDRNTIVDPRLKADLAAARTDPAACLIAWLLCDVERFVRRHMRREHRVSREVLEGELRGSVLIDEYVDRHLAEGRAQEAPCEFPDLTRDTPSNRAIRATVRHALTLLPLLHVPAARFALRRKGRRVLSLFAGVSDQRLRSYTFRELNRIGYPSSYDSIVRRCEAFAAGMHLDLDVGPTSRQAFLWDMNRLFEQALAGVLTEWPGGSLQSGGRPSAVIRGPDGAGLQRAKVDPDHVLTTATGTLLLDAKYKDTGVTDGARELSVPGAGTVRVRRADVYQAVAYRNHDAYPGAKAGLVYPVALGSEEKLPAPRTVTGFGAPVYLLFVDVGVHAETNRAAFYAQLDAVLEVPEGSVLGST